MDGEFSDADIGMSKVQVRYEERTLVFKYTEFEPNRVWTKL